MEIIEVTASEYIQIIPTPYHVFGSGAFARLNATKASEVYYLLFKEGKYRLGLTVGKRGECLFSPFSAPFGGFIFLNNEVRISHIDEAIDCLINWCSHKGINEIRIILPPPLYSESFVAKQVNALYRKGFGVAAIDLNYSFNLHNLVGDYQRRIWRNARKNLAISMAANLFFNECYSEQQKVQAYDIIRQNREQHGYPLRMTWEQMKETSNLIEADFFIVSISKNIPVAAAIVFHVAEQIVQVIYWGDLAGFAHMKTMNFLSYSLFNHYKAKGIKITDIGPSTENSVPNHGLCEFKESIGCDISQKISFCKNL